MYVRNFGFTMLLALSLGRALSAQPQCSIAQLVGTWGFSEIGWTVPLGSGANAVAYPVTIIGAFSIDHSGKMTGSGTSIDAKATPGTPLQPGDVLDWNFAGTIEISPDCTGTSRFTLTIMGMPLPGPLTERFFYSPQKDEMVSMSIQSPLSKPMWIGKFSRLSHVPSPVAWPAISR